MTDEPSKLDIVECIDPDWTDHFASYEHAYEFYATDPKLIADAIKELQA